MLTITVLEEEFFDEEKKQFVNTDGVTLQLEHSLVSLSKWESIYEKPFLGSSNKTEDELYGYIHAMILTPDISMDVVKNLPSAVFDKINNYIEAKMTATWFSEIRPSPKTNEVITSELIYYWMTVFNIPMACENWHLNRLFTLIRICNLKQSKPKKMSRGDVMARNRELNARRKAEFGTSG